MSEVVFRLKIKAIGSKPMALDNRQVIDQIVLRREALASMEAAEAEELLHYVDRARVAGERIGGAAQGRRRAESAVHELSLAMTLPVPTIERRVSRARRLRSSMPNVWRSWHEGRISTDAVNAVDRAAFRLVHPDSVAALDDIVVDRIARLTPGQATRWLDRWVGRTEAEESRRRHEIAHRDRKVGLRPLGDGMTRMTAEITSADAAAIMQRLSGAAHQLPATDDRTIDQARADLLVDTLLDRREGGLGYRAVVGITVPLSSLMGFSDAPAELTDRSATIPAHIVRAAMVDEKSLLYRLVTDDVGNLMTVSWLGRFSPARLDQVLEFRDGTSVFPTSSVPARMCDTDHSDPWPAPTCAANTGPLNRRAHNLKTEGHLRVRQPAPGVFEWTTRTGHTYTRTPEPLPVADWDSPD
ncbi:13E12 repeat family protein [Aeromicrobium wangtongii]|uniref:13E12 repeat family protein n=2 Tax=Aeromicrobium wangtongii TaxID=2969247 RepID=A0ABY5M5V5_9ACTN|nr:13E12 repeat family protein [Aeromicrobium wangtongii]UUP12344.1 13E12 repeat family protein [Aeromicrobium wangtongii]